MAQWFKKKKSACNARYVGLIPGLGRSPGGSKSDPTAVFLPGKSHRQRSLAGYCTWGHKALDSMEHMCLLTRPLSSYCLCGVIV